MSYEIIKITSSDEKQSKMSDLLCVEGDYDLWEHWTGGNSVGYNGLKVDLRDWFNRPHIGRKRAETKTK